MGFAAQLLPPWGSCPEGTEGASAQTAPLRLYGGSPLHRFAGPLPQRGRN
jgi:hypothetical protein